MVRSLRDRLRTANDPAEKFRVLEVALLERLNERFQLNTAVRYALQEFARRPEIPRVQELAHGAGLSRRRFSQLFREQIGLTPKLYCRLQRFQNTLKVIASDASVDWAQLALSAGYSDQAHLAHEFHDFAGLSPSAYLASPSPSGLIFPSVESTPPSSHFYKTAFRIFEKLRSRLPHSKCGGNDT
jgi:transcriptional regulator GlxA family with amidase domain